MDEACLTEAVAKIMGVLESVIISLLCVVTEPLSQRRILSEHKNETPASSATNKKTAQKETASALTGFFHAYETVQRVVESTEGEVHDVFAQQEKVMRMEGVRLVTRLLLLLVVFLRCLQRRTTCPPCLSTRCHSWRLPA